ncbi:MAG: 4Fe-4S binding protein [Deltaproteobacteria bacterium]|jgi:polyferredoxin|nr:4Fe-4S binding protein [Deltaproteobacteria bacterium]
MLSGRFRPLGGGEEVFSSLRVICCTSVDLKELTEKKFFNETLYDLLAEQTLEIPPLRRRKKDLSILVDYLVAHYSQELDKPVTSFDRKAYGEIMAYDWPGNMDELEVVVRRAVNLASFGKVALENLFIGVTPTIGKFSFNLLNLPKVKKLFISTWYPAALQLLTGVFFLYIFYLGFWGTQNPDKNVSLVLTWGIWEPMVVMSTIFAARIWCGICPIGAVSSLCSRNFSLKLSAPHFLRKYGYYIGGVGLGVIILSEVIFNMITSPRATAALIVSIAIPAVVFGLLYKRRVWCRYLCPLGKMIGVFSSASVIELRANYGICNNDCLTHSCYMGGKECQDGCPMFEGPFSLRSNLDCTLCANCIKNCPNQSPQINLRLPGYELWSSRRFEKTMAFLVPLIMGTQFFRGLENAGYLHHFLAIPANNSYLQVILLATITLLIFGVIKSVERFLLRGIPDKALDSTGMLSYGFLVMALAYEVAFHLERFLLMGGQLVPVLGRQLGFNWEGYGASGAPWAITTLQIMIIMAGGWGASAVLKRIYRSCFEISPEKPPVSWRIPVMLTAICYIWFFIAG